MDNLQKMRELRLLIKDGDTEKAEVLLRDDPALLHVSTPFGSWLHVAASFGKLEIVRLLVGLGIDVNAQGGTFNGGALNLAASAGHVEVAEYLIQCGALLDVSEPERNPLFGAIYGGHIEMVTLLVDSGIDTNVRYTGNSMTNMGAVEFAIERGQEEIAGLLKDLNVRFELGGGD